MMLDPLGQEWQASTLVSIQTVLTNDDTHVIEESRHSHV